MTDQTMIQLLLAVICNARDLLICLSGMIFAEVKRLLPILVCVSPKVSLSFTWMPIVLMTTMPLRKLSFRFTWIKKLVEWEETYRSETTRKVLLPPYRQSNIMIPSASEERSRLIL